ncbi:hypothetical protein FQA39_LY10034 [Lamprigera yunnana]|nr:hypothetical protein FQA39_LY10034 [Lamprigera yunnana]
MIVEAALILVAIQLTLGDREHKVHNIVLYPERYSWCKTTPIKQVVASPGYESVTIDNNVCVGACYSYSIPITQPAEPGELIRPYCDSCQPVKTRCYHVTLNADSENVNGPKTIQKRIQIITNCLCVSCEKVQDTDCDEEQTLELPSDLFSMLHPESVNKATFETKLLPPEEVPDLLQFSPAKSTNDLTINVDKKHEQKFKLNAQLKQLLKSIKNSDETIEYDPNEMKELIEIFEDSNHNLNDKKLIDFINFVEYNTDDIDLDFNRFKAVLNKFKKNNEVFERHRTYGLGDLKQGQDNNVAINRDLDNLGKGKNFGIEGNHVIEHNHIDTKVNLKIKNHHVGEPQRIGLDIGHLVRGPHGSLAFTPDVQEKLSLETDLIKPNQEGTVISYENQPKSVE